MSVNVISLITNDSVTLYVVDSAPSSSPGLSATLGSEAVWNNGTSAYKYLKNGNADTAWDLISTSSISGIVNSGTAGRLSLYAATGNALSDTYVQNSQNMNVDFTASPTRSAGIVYNIPNPGDAITSADFVLTQGSQNIAGLKTFTNDVTISANLNVTGIVTKTNTVDLQVTNKLITVNEGGLAGSANSSGIEFYEAGTAAPGYFQVSSDRLGMDFLAPSLAVGGVTSWVESLSSSNLTASRVAKFADYSGTMVMRPDATPGVSSQIAYYNGANSIISASGFTYVAGVLTSQNMTISSLGLGIAHVSAAGVISSSAIALGGADVTGTLLLANGGSSASLTASAGSIVYSTASAMAMSAVGTAGQALVSGAAAAPTWFAGTGVVHASSGVLSAGSVSLIADVSGILSIANGGTNASSFTSSGAIYFNGTSLVTDTADFMVYDGSGHTGIGGVSNASYTLSVNGAANFTSSINAVSEVLSGAGASFELNDTTAAIDSKTNAYTILTTDSTVTTIATLATASNTIQLVEIKGLGIRTGGTAGTAMDSYSMVRTFKIKNIAGTVSIQNFQSDYTERDQVTFNITAVVSGTTVLVQVTGATNNNLTHRAFITVTK